MNNNYSPLSRKHKFFYLVQEFALLNNTHTLKKKKSVRATHGKPRHDVRGLFAAAIRYRAGADCAPVLLLALYAAVLLPARHETPRPACALLAPRPLSPCSPARPFACQLTARRQSLISVGNSIPSYLLHISLSKNKMYSIFFYLPRCRDKVPEKFWLIMDLFGGARYPAGQPVQQPDEQTPNIVDWFLSNFMPTDQPLSAEDHTANPPRSWSNKQKTSRVPAAPPCPCAERLGVHLC